MKHLLKVIYHFFIPNKKNDYKAKSLHIDMLSAYLFIAITLVFVSKTTPLFSHVLGVATDITAEKLLEYTNEERKSHALSALSLNEQLSQAAKLKAQDMFKKDYWAHFAPDGSSPWDFIKQSGYVYEYAGENLAKNFLFSKNVVDAWMKSTSHRENLLQKNYTDVGFAVVNGMLNGEETTLVVQMFGSPIKQLGQSPQQAPSQEKPVSVPNQQVLGKKAVSTPPVSAKTPYSITLFFVLFIGIALILDLLVAAKLNILHLRSKHLIHIMFIGFIAIGILFILKNGAIL